MALTQRLQIRQSQALVMTPQLMQAIKLLQLSNLDLVAYVEAELERNPLLDRSADDEPARRAGPPENSGQSGRGRRDLGPRRRTASRAGDAIEDRARYPVDDVFPDEAEPSRPRAAEGPAAYSEWAGVGSGGRDDGEYNLEAFVSAETTLADWLREQLTLAIADPVRRMIGQYLIDLVDEAGYLSSDLDAGGGKARHQRRRNRGRARHPAKLRSARRLRARSRRMPGDPAQGTQSLRSGDGRR